MSEIKIYCDNELIDGLLIAKCVKKALGQRAPIYIEIIFVEPEEIRTLNRKFRGVDSVTDVLSFPMLDNVRGKRIRKSDFRADYDEDEKAIFLGSIAICPERAREQAAEYGHSERRELNYLAVHGILHLFGYDHTTEEDKREMRGLEEEILTLMGVTRDV